MDERDAAVAVGLRARVRRALRQRSNWEELAKFCAVGASGYIVNLLVYVALLDGADLHYRLAATGSFLVAVTNNYLWNRLWTFRRGRGHFGHQGLRFFVVSVIVYVGNLAILTLLVRVGLGKIVAQAIAIGKVADTATRVTEAWTGPQVAWKMARGYNGAFGGKKINSLRYWLPFCFVFLLGLLDFRRPLSLRNLDLLALLSFSVSLWYFNHGNVFTSVPLVYPPLVYLLLRCVWIGWKGRTTPSRPLWPAWVLLAATVFLTGFRIGLNLEDSNVIDVGYAGVIGAQRIAAGVMPYNNFPVEDSL